MTRPLRPPVRRDPNAEDLSPVTTNSGAERRVCTRRESSQHVAVRFGETDIICDLIELSESGAKFSAMNCDVPTRGEALSITLFDGTPLTGTVSWARPPQFGVAFKEPLACVDDKLDFEDLGRAYFAKAVALQKAAQNRS